MCAGVADYLYLFVFVKILEKYLLTALKATRLEMETRWLGKQRKQTALYILAPLKF